MEPKKYLTYIRIRTQFEGFHCWPDAPDNVSFLRDRHRHLFQVLVTFQVDHADREREFFTEKAKIDSVLEIQRWKSVTKNWSCEHWATFIADEFDASCVEVSEDGENAAFAIADRSDIIRDIVRQVIMENQRSGGLLHRAN